MKDKRSNGQSVPQNAMNWIYEKAQKKFNKAKKDKEFWEELKQEFEELWGKIEDPEAEIYYVEFQAYNRAIEEANRKGFVEELETDTLAEGVNYRFKTIDGKIWRIEFEYFVSPREVALYLEVEK